MKHVFTQEQDEYLKANYAKQGTQGLPEMFKGIERPAIQRHARNELGLKFKGKRTRTPWSINPMGKRPIGSYLPHGELTKAGEEK